MKSSDYLFSASFGLYRMSMRTLYASIDNGTDLNLFRYDGLHICWPHKLVTSAHIPRLGDANGRPLQLLVMVVLCLLLRNSHFCVSLIVTKHLTA